MEIKIDIYEIAELIKLRDMQAVSGCEVSDILEGFEKWKKEGTATEVICGSEACLGGGFVQNFIFDNYCPVTLEVGCMGGFFFYNNWEEENLPGELRGIVGKK